MFSSPLVLSFFSPQRCRYPAQDRSRKEHNVSVALECFRQDGLPESDTVLKALDIADANRDKTLDLLWRM